MKRVSILFICIISIASFGNSITIQEQTAFFGAKQAPSSGGGGGGTFSLLVHAIGSASGSGTATTTAADTTGAKLIVLAVASAQNVAMTVTDSKGNTLTPATAVVDAPYKIQFYYVCNPGSVGSGHTFSAQGTSAFPMITMEAFSYTGSTPTFDNENGNHAASGSSILVGAVSSTSGGRVAIAALTTQGTGDTYACDNSFANSDSAKSAFGGISISMAHLEQASGASVNPTWTLTGGAESHLAAADIAFK